MLWLLGIACSLGADPPADRRVTAVSARSVLQGDWRGLSGLSRSDEGLLAVAERQGLAARLDVDGTVLGQLPLVGVPQGLDTEAIAVLGDGRILLGTESQVEGRESDHILVAEQVEGELRVTGDWSVSYLAFGVKAPDNRGVEGLCTAGEVVIAVGEHALQVEGGRAAPAWWIDADTGQSQPLRLALTTSSGKLAGADCQPEGDGVRLWAVERHFAVMRISTWLLAGDEAQAVQAPQHTWDLSPALPDQPNLEGLVVRDGKAWLVRDNDYGGVQGPSELIVLALDREAAPQ